LHISYKPQKISPKSQGTVRQLLHEKIRDAYVHPQVGIFLISGGFIPKPNVALQWQSNSFSVKFAHGLW
jgi:hypothetical protein